MIREVSHDRCPKCSVGGEGGLFRPELEVTTHGQDPRLASGGVQPTLEGRGELVDEQVHGR